MYIREMKFNSIVYATVPGESNYNVIIILQGHVCYIT